MKYFILFAWVLLMSLPLCSQEASSLVEKRVERYIGWMLDKNKPDVWVAAARLEGLGKGAVPLIKAKVNSLPELPQVACAKVLIHLGEKDYGISILMQVVEKGENSDARIYAASVIGVYGDFDLEESMMKAIDKIFDPHIKMAMAKALWQISRHPKASSILKAYLNSEDREIRYTAALALGEIGNIGEARPILSQLKDEPSLRGRLAKSLLEKELMVSRYERLLDAQGEAKKTPEKPSQYAVVEEIIEKIKKYHITGDKFSSLELLDSAIKGMVSHTDLHSAFWTEKEWADFQKSIVFEEYVGIGVYVGDQNGYFTVIAPIYSGPAYRAGIRSMDRILKVEEWSTTGKPIEEIVSRIKGKEGTSVKLTIYRAGWAKLREIEVAREKIKIPTHYYDMLPNKIGYIRLTQFGRQATINIQKSLRDLKAQGMKALVFDLRGNAGGWLGEAVDIVDQFLDGGKLIVYSEGRDSVKGRKNQYYSSSKDAHTDFPMVILVDGSSASASEIVAGTLQHYKRAILVGTRTYGKGSVQEPLELDSRPGARLKLTIARYYLPDGRCIHNDMDSAGNVTKKNGVLPEVQIDYEQWEPWKNEEYTKIKERKKFDEYIDAHYAKNKDLFSSLADNDHLKTESYPEFDKWYETLETKASKQDVRWWLRSQIRGKVADERGKEHACDYIEDVMLQAGIVEIYKKWGIDPQTTPEYKEVVSRLEALLKARKEKAEAEKKDSPEKKPDSPEK